MNLTLWSLHNLLDVQACSLLADYAFSSVELFCQNIKGLDYSQTLQDITSP